MNIARRKLLAAFGGAAAWPVAARAEQVARMQTIGVLMPLAAEDPEAQSRLVAFGQGLQQLGWTVGRNVRIEMRWAAGDPERIRLAATDLVALAPSVVLTTGSATVGTLLQATRVIPIVFVAVPDPVGAGFVANLAKPGGNVTGFLPFEYGIAPKWLELLKQLSPDVTRVAVIRDPDISAGIGLFGAIQAVGSLFGVQATPIGVRDVGQIERELAAFAEGPNGGLIVTGSARAVVHRDVIIALAARYKLPAVYWDRALVVSGGLLCYGVDLLNQYHRAAGYVDRILKGEKPADLPVQAPTKYELAINLKTAKALGLDIPPTLLARADEVIE
jgi:putative ABC transport system substrate-binding protein